MPHDLHPVVHAQRLKRVATFRLSPYRHVVGSPGDFVVFDEDGAPWDVLSDAIFTRRYSALQICKHRPVTQ